MNPDELRALADALEPMAKAPRFEDFDMPAFCAWLRACANAQPVAWRYTQPDSSAWCYSDIPVFPYVCESPYTHPAPAAPQAEPIDPHMIVTDDRFPDEQAEPKEGNNVWKQIVPDDEPQAEPKREPLSDERIDEIGDPFGYFQYGDAQGDKRRAFARAVERAAYERAAQECELQITGSDYRFLVAHGHWDHMAQAATNCAAAIRALGRQHEHQ